MLIVQGVSISKPKRSRTSKFRSAAFQQKKKNRVKNPGGLDIVPVSIYLSWEDYQDLGTNWVNHLIYSFYEGNLTLAFAISTLTVSAGQDIEQQIWNPWKVVVGRLWVFGNFQGCNLSGPSGVRKKIILFDQLVLKTHFLKLWKTANYNQAEAMVLDCTK